MPAASRSLFSLIAPTIIVCLMTACSSNEPSSIANRLPETYQATESIRYRVEGGGNVDFTMAALEDSFIINVTAYQFEDRHDFFVLPGSDIDPFVVGLADSVFSGMMNVGGTIYVNETPTGT